MYNKIIGIKDHIESKTNKETFAEIEEKVKNNITLKIEKETLMRVLSPKDSRFPDVMSDTIFVDTESSR